MNWSYNNRLRSRISAGFCCGPMATAKRRTTHASLVGLAVMWLFCGVQTASAFYNPSTGRWLSCDPIGERGGRNFYGFGRNDPISRFDRLGLEVNNPTLYVTMPCLGKPDGPPSVVQAPNHLKAWSGIKIILIGRDDDSEINLPGVGSGFEYMVGNEPEGTACVVRYSCSQKCADCCGKKFTATYNGQYDGMAGRTNAKYVKQLPGDQQQYFGTHCVPDADAEKFAQQDCEARSRGRCDSTTTIKAH
jgi:hypothetical protein